MIKYESLALDDEELAGRVMRIYMLACENIDIEITATVKRLKMVPMAKILIFTEACFLKKAYRDDRGELLSAKSYLFA